MAFKSALIFGLFWPAFSPILARLTKAGIHRMFAEFTVKSRWTLATELAIAQWETGGGIGAWIGQTWMTFGQNIGRWRCRRTRRKWLNAEQKLEAAGRWAIASGDSFFYDGNNIIFGNIWRSEVTPKPINLLTIDKLLAFLVWV
jgi:hypothetical protein